MAEFSVELNRLKVGAESIYWAQMSPLHKKRIELCLSNYFSKHPNQLQGQKNLFRTNIEKSPEWKEIDRIVSYYKHMGFLSTKPIDPAIAKMSQQAAAHAVIKMGEASIPGASGHLIAGARLADDTLSVTRNILFSIPAIGANDPVVSHLGYYAGILWTFFALREVDAGVVDYKRAKTIQDAEGKFRAQARLVSGQVVATASLGYLAGRVSDTLGASHLATAIFGATNVLFGIGSMIALAMSSLGWLRCYRFSQRLDEYLDHKKITHVDKLEGTIRFLRDSITVTPEEVVEIRMAVEHKYPAKTDAEKERLIEQKICHKAEMKVKHLKRRTSNKSIQLILSQADSILAKLQSEETRAEGIKEATVLIHRVRNQNRIKMGLYVLGFVAAVIGFVAMLIFAFGSAGTVPFILYGITGMIYLPMSLYSAIGLFKKDPERAQLDLHPMQDLSLH